MLKLPNIQTDEHKKYQTSQKSQRKQKRPFVLLLFCILYTILTAQFKPTCNKISVALKL